MPMRFDECLKPLQIVLHTQRHRIRFISDSFYDALRLILDVGLGRVLKVSLFPIPLQTHNRLSVRAGQSKHHVIGQQGAIGRVLL